MKDKLLIPILLCLGLGLAPFNPPHIWKQYQNLVHGREMLAMDWIDVAMHGAPWIYLIYVIITIIRSKKK